MKRPRSETRRRVQWISACALPLLLAAGVYYLRLDWQGYRVTRPIILLPVQGEFVR